MNIEYQLCCGCGACATVCPMSCVELKTTSEGFYQATIQSGRCIDCGKCLSVCPMEDSTSIKNKKTPVSAYAVYHSNEQVRQKSTSGGVFYQLAKNILVNGGVVFGALFDESFHLKHDAVVYEGELDSLCGSKYLQSDLTGVYKAVKGFLYNGTQVFFVGTPCQIAALYAVVGHHEKLLTADLVCHGVPSPGLFHSYISYLEKRYRGKIIHYCFRSKEHANSRISYTAKVELVNQHMKKKTIYMNGDEEPYTLRYLTNSLQCKSCYQCPYATHQRVGDVTLGDFWGYETVYPELESISGVSLVLVNSMQGKKALAEAENLIKIDTRKELYLERNQHLSMPPTKSSERDELFQAYAAHGFTSYFYHHVFLPRGYKVYLLKRRIRGILKWIKKSEF